MTELSAEIEVDNERRDSSANKHDMIKIRIKRLKNSEGKQPPMPRKMTCGAAGFDLCYFGERTLIIPPAERLLVPTGLVAELPEDTVALIFPRSGIAAKYGITLANCVGVIDSDYRGEIKIPLINQSHNGYNIEPYDRIAQMVIVPLPHIVIEESLQISQTDRADGGFGSSGKR